MKVTELVEKLREFPGDMLVVCDIDDGWSTFDIDQVYIGNIYHDTDGCFGKAVILE